MNFLKKEIEYKVKGNHQPSLIIRIEIKKVQRLEGEIILPRVPRASPKGIKSKQ